MEIDALDVAGDRVNQRMSSIRSDLIDSLGGLPWPRQISENKKYELIAAIGGILAEFLHVQETVKIMIQKEVGTQTDFREKKETFVHGVRSKKKVAKDTSPRRNTCHQQWYWMPWWWWPPWWACWF